MDWIRNIKENENEALEDIYRLYRGPCITWILREWSLEKEDAIEIFQLSIVILYDNVVSGRLTNLTSDLKTYLFGIVRNKVRELKRNKKKLISFSAHDYLVSYTSSENNEKALLEENISAANKAMEELGNPCKKLLQLFYYKQKNMDDIAKIMQYKNRNTVKTQKYKCLRRLQKLYFRHINIEKVERS